MLLLLAVVFLGPMAIAMALYYTGFQWRPEGTMEHGELFRPARPLPPVIMSLVKPNGGTATLQGKWTLIYAGPGECAAACQQALFEIRQVRLALGRDRDRVQRLYCVTAGTPDRGFLQAEHPGIGILEVGSSGQELISVIGQVHDGDIFIADPLGNLMMRYPAGTGMKGIHEDLQHLLKVSTIG